MIHLLCNNRGFETGGAGGGDIDGGGEGARDIHRHSTFRMLHIPCTNRGFEIGGGGIGDGGEGASNTQKHCNRDKNYKHCAGIKQWAVRQPCADCSGVGFFRSVFVASLFVHIYHLG